MIGDRWGVTDAEVRRHYGCDDLLAGPAVAAWRGVTVRTRPEAVWPWLAQIRLGPYSYDWIDNLGRPSPRELRGLPDPVVGERFTSAFGGIRVGRIRSVTVGEELTGELSGVLMSYVLAPEGHTTRLLLKLAMPATRVLAPLITVGDLFMARRQLLNFAALAECSAGAGE